MKKRIIGSICYFFVCLLVISFLFARLDKMPTDTEAASYFEVAAQYPAFSGTSARASALIDAKSGKTIYAENENERLSPASTTKIMTALLIIENCDLEKAVDIPDCAVGVEGSSMYLYRGEKMKIMDLLAGLLLESGNDAAEALAVICAGSVEDFVCMMNEKAEKMGLSNTHFDNPHGLTSDTHYTTAKELAEITCEAMKNEVFKELVLTKSMDITSCDGVIRHLYNHNKLLWRYDGICGVKTGYTLAAGRCLVSACERDGSEFIAVTLCDRNDYNDHMRLYDYAFENYQSIKLIDAFSLGMSREENGLVLRIENTEPIYLTLPKNTKGKYKMRLDADISDLYIRQNGEVIGKLTAEYGGKVIAKSDVAVYGE